ncbi:MAG: hypothetical protein ABEK42_11170 [Thiohalorhabdaceae bacterium]
MGRLVGLDRPARLRGKAVQQPAREQHRGPHKAHRGHHRPDRLQDLDARLRVRRGDVPEGAPGPGGPLQPAQLAHHAQENPATQKPQQERRSGDQRRGSGMQQAEVAVVGAMQQAVVRHQTRRGQCGRHHHHRHRHQTRQQRQESPDQQQVGPLLHGHALDEVQHPGAEEVA